jgi:hypothetical protein
MCVVSNLGDHYGRRDTFPWQPAPPAPWTLPPQPLLPQRQDFQKILDEWIARNEKTGDDPLEKRVAALEELLRKGKEHDAATGQPDCELDEKRERLKQLARELGVEIAFP